MGLYPSNIQHQWYWAVIWYCSYSGRGLLFCRTRRLVELDLQPEIFEGGRVSESIIYANGLNQIRQSQTYLPSKNTSIVVQSAYDYTGRQVVSSVPIPVASPSDKKGIAGYRAGVLQNNQSSLFNASDFDLNSNVNAPSSLQNNQYTSYYNGSTDRVADAEGFAYSRVTYYNDGSNRVKEQSGIGRMHSIGTEPNQGKTTKFYYVTPTDLELISLFGEEAPDARSVLKTLTVDPNGEASVTYTSLDGKVLATALVDTSFNAQRSRSLLDLDEQTRDTLTNILTLRGSEGFLVSKRMAFAMPTPVSLKYIFKCNDIEVKDACVGIGCVYNLNVRILNLDGDSVVLVKEYQKKLFADDCGKQFDLENQYVLEPGNYMIVRKLTFAGDPVAAANQVEEKNRARITPVKNVICDWLYEIKNVEDVKKFCKKMDNFTGSISDSQCQYFNTLVDSGVIWHCKQPNLLQALDITLDLEFRGAFPSKLILQTSCADLSVPLDLTPSYICPRDTIQAADTSIYTFGTYVPNDTLVGLMDFEGYLKANLTQEEWDAFDYSTNLPGFEKGKGEFNRMIYHMMNDKYLYNEVYGRQYTCQQLWEGWKSAVDIYSDLSTTSSSVQGNLKGDDQNDQYDEHFDKIKVETGFFLTNWIARRKLKKDIPRQVRAQDKAVINLDMLRIFMEKVEYKFAAMVKPDSISAYVLPADYDEYMLSRYQYASEIITKPVEGIQKPLYRYLVAPVFLFKYFEYTNNEQYVDPKISNYLNFYSICDACEKIHNYDSDEKMDPDCYFDLEMISEHDRFSWTTQERNNFYKCIISDREVLALEPSEEDDVIYNCSNIQPTLEEMRLNKENACIDIVSSRRSEFYSLVVRKFTEAGLTIYGCPGNEDVVPANVVTEAVDSLMAQALRMCHINPANCSCTDVYCDDFAFDYPKTVIGTPCERLQMNQAMYGVLEMNLGLDNPNVGFPDSPAQQCSPEALKSDKSVVRTIIINR